MSQIPDDIKSKSQSDVSNSEVNNKILQSNETTLKAGSDSYWGADLLSPEFNFLNVPEETYDFLQAGTPLTNEKSVPSPSLFNHTETPMIPSNPSSSHATPNPSINANKTDNQQNYLLNHYQSLLNQSKVPMKQALSPVTYVSPSTSNAASSPNVPINHPLHPDNVQKCLQQQQQAAQSFQHPSSQESSNNNSSKANPNPCDHCRRRQIKCITVPNMPNCVQCETKGIKCTHSESPSNPSLKRNMGVVQDSNEFNKRPRFSSNSSITPTQRAMLSQQSQNMRKPQQLTIQYPRSSFFVGSSSMFDHSLLDRIRLDKIDQVQLNSSLSLRKVSNDVQFILRDDYTDDLAINADKNVDAVENIVAPHGQALVNTYFKIIHPSFPILHRKVFLEKYARSYREFSAPLLAAVYSLATQWWDQDPNLSQHQKPDINALNAIALRTFTEVTERPRLSAVQAGLLLLQCRSENPNNWILCQQVVSLAEELGLGLDCQNWKLPKWERGLRRRLAWAVWIQEKWIALIESRVSHFVIGRNWLVRNVTNEDFPEHPARRTNQGDEDYKSMLNDIENGKFLFKEMIELSLIMGEIMETFYSYSAIQTITRVDQVLKLAKPLQLQLRQWYHSLPPGLQMNAAQNEKLCSNGYLHLSYFATEITLHRKIILSLTDDTPPELVKVCRAAATARLTAVIDFVKLLKREHIYAFWNSSTSSNFAIVGTFAAILYVTAPTPQEASIYKDHINIYRMLLFKLSRFFKQAFNALKRIDMLLNHVPGLIKDSAQPSQFNEMSPSSNISAGQSPVNNNNSNNSNNNNNNNFQALSPYLHQQMSSNLPNSQNMPNNQPSDLNRSNSNNNNNNNNNNNRRSGPPVTTIKREPFNTENAKLSPTTLSDSGRSFKNGGTPMGTTRSNASSPIDTRIGGDGTPVNNNNNG